MATFVLVHGACHGSWCWEALAPRLAALGHAVVTPHLPCDDPDAGLPEYAAAVEAAVGPARDDLVLVGHSLGGLTVPVVAQRLPARAMVFLAGIIAVPGKSLADLADDDADRDAPLEQVTDFRTLGNGTFVFTEAGALRALYHDCDDETALAAARRLRPQRSLWAEPSPVTQWPAVRMASIVCTHDRIVNRPWAERTAQERLGVEPVLLDSGHCPMLSQPGTLAEVLSRLAAG